jgi:uncharacterized repeat protein (TIGR03803 family)
MLTQSGTPVLAAGRQWMRGHVPAAVGRLQPLERLPATNRLELVIGLPLRDPAGLNVLLEGMYDPARPEFHQYLTPAAFAERFGPSRADYEAVIAFAKAHGLRVTATHPNRTLLDVSGEVADIERACHVSLHLYRHPTEARNFYAPDRQPWLDLGVPVILVGGLDNYSLPRPAGLRLLPLATAADAAGGVKPAVAGSGPRGFLMGRDFRAAYAPGVALNGAGEALGLFELDGYYTTDVLAYENLAGLPNVPVTNVLVNGFSGRPGSGNAEVVLDIDMAICMAPGLSQVIVYEASTTTSPYDVLNRMANDTNSLGQVVARQLSSSWLWSTPSTEAQNQVFQQFAAQGQSFFQASGDDGAYCGAGCKPGTPADNPNVTVVGGTTLSTSSPAGAWQSEKVWSWFPGSPAASGGGFGTNYAIPCWQQGIDMTANGGSPTLRNSPDVACVADAIWLIANNGEQFDGAGTSAAAPLWAGFAALVNQQAASGGQPGVGFINPAVYAIGKSSLYATAFHDTTVGNNTNTCCGPNRFSACPGYDLCTGWGTPTGSNLISALLAPPPALRITPTTALTFSGPAGAGGPGQPPGPFQPAVQSFLLTNDSNTPFSWSVGFDPPPPPPMPPPPPLLNVSPSSGTLTNGGSAMSVNVTVSGAASRLYPGSYSTTLWFTNLSDGSAQSRLVTVDVVAPPLITAQPTNQSVLEGMAASFTVAVANSASLSYQWQYDNGRYLTNLSNGGNISGATSSTLTIANASPAEAGAYSVIVSNAAGALSSAPAFLAVFPWRPTITAQPADQSVLAGQTVTFTVGAVGDQPLFYLWQRNGTTLSDGGNIFGSATSALTLRSVTPSDAATYAVVVGNSDGLASSTGAVLSVTSITASNASLSTVYSFTGGQDGANPNALVRHSNGSFYGTTQNGGTDFAGTVFRLAPDGALTSLYSFTDGDDGATPFAPLTQGPDGNLYGTAYQGGTNDNGSIYRITPNGVFSPLLSFNIANGDLPYAPLTLGTDGNFYGTTYQGGAGGRGTAFRVTTNGALTTLYSFLNGADGGHVAAGLLQATDGYFYGATYKGGAYGDGTVFRVTAGGALTTLVSFNRNSMPFFGAARGALPLSGLVQDKSGVLYGATSSGGMYGNGELFCISTAGTFGFFTHAFTGGSDGSYPAAPLLLASDGNFYGTTAYGGDYGYGTLFRFTPGGALTTLVAFDGYAGANPQAALVEDADGLLGTTQNGGASGAGVIFHLTFSGPPEITDRPTVTLNAFVGDTVSLSVGVSGARPLSYQWQRDGTNLVDGSNITGANSHVLTLSDLTINDGSNYSLLASNSYGTATASDIILQVLSWPPSFLSGLTNVTPNPCTTVSFNVLVMGNQPMTLQWQKNGVNLSDSCYLSGSTTASLVISNVIEADNGTYTIAATNSAGSSQESATLTVVSKTAACTSLSTRHWFGHGSDGRNPSSLIQGTNGLLYGTTYYDGPHSWGTVFSLTPDGVFTTLASFSETNGANPSGPLVQGADGGFYGATFWGGTESAGTIFAMTADGALTTLYSLNGDSDGSSPTGALAQGADGNFYGTANSAGANGYGCVFRVSPDGAFTNLYSFSGGVDGYSPTAGLAAGSDGNFYGLTFNGGTRGLGNIFRITPGGVLTTVYSFTGGTDGSAPTGPLVRGSDGNFYGAASQGGLGTRGTAFRFTPAGTLTTLHAFPNLAMQDGIYPLGGIIQSSDGNLYGTTSADYKGGYGTLFQLSPDGLVLNTLLYFDGCNDGSHPQTALFEAADGSIYGTTSAGGPCQAGQGTVFRLSLGCAPTITTQPASQAAVAGANVLLSVASSGARPFCYQWKRNGTNLVDGGNLSGSTARTLALAGVSLADSATYSVSLSNSLGSVTSAAAHLTVVYPPAFLSAVNSNCTLALTYSTMSGQKYRLLYKNDLRTNTWSALGGTITASSNALTAYDNPCTNSQRFYRLLLIPQIQ